MEDLKEKLKLEIIEQLNLEEVSPEEIENDAPLFGDGLGLDSIDALELIVLLDQNYGLSIPSPEQGKDIIRYIEVEPSDIEIANKLALQIFSQTTDELSAPARRVNYSGFPEYLVQVSVGLP